MYKANLRFAHDKFSQFEVDTLFALYSAPVAGLPWPAYMNLLLKRLFDAEYARLRDNGGKHWWAGVKLDPDMLLLTVKGREFVKSLSVHELDNAG